MQTRSELLTKPNKGYRCTADFILPILWLPNSLDLIPVDHKSGL